MAYAFKGFFSRAPGIDAAQLQDGHVFRDITAPFQGCGVFAPDIEPTFDACLAYLKALGVSDQDWLFLDYATWAGPVERVCAFGARSGARFGPIESDRDPAEAAFRNALTAFGLDGRETYFPPFERGFWGVV